MGIESKLDWIHKSSQGWAHWCRLLLWCWIFRFHYIILINLSIKIHKQPLDVSQLRDSPTGMSRITKLPSITNKYLLSSFPEHFPKSVWPYTVLDIYSLVFANVMLQNMNTDCSLFHLSPCQSMWKTWLFSGHDNWISIPVSRLGARNSYYDNLWSEFKYECTNFMTKLCIGCTMRDGYSILSE